MIEEKLKTWVLCLESSKNNTIRYWGSKGMCGL
jgi:hypothetical protein